MRKLIKKIRVFIFTLIAIRRLGAYKVKPRVSGFTLLTKKTFIGRNVNFNGFRIYGEGRVDIGDNFHSGSGCKIITQVHNYKGNALPYDNTYIIKNVKIGDNVWFGMDVTILSNCEIGEGVIVQAGSVIVSDIPKCSIAGGNPAKVFAMRDIEHYEELKIKGQFH
ncbi:acyltransferase [Serratia fonticola]|uniref:acyltransferase n=3 Tax=Serratia fonticola TaxID=47917 RepID=UPI0034C6CB4A